MSTITTAAHPLATPVAPGQPWPDTDCIYAGIMRGDKRQLYHLLVSPAVMDLSRLKWGAYGEEITGADSQWDGLANTRALLKSGLDLPAARTAAVEGELAEDGWYLPAQRELALCWATIPHHFRTDDWYWSSTQYSARSAWVQDFSGGPQNINLKDYTGRVRPVRRLIIQ